MTTEVRLVTAESRYDVVPGQPFVISLHVYNATKVIDGFTATILGLDPAWVMADPAPLSLFPDHEGDILLTVTLPSVYPSGTHALAISVQSTTDPGIVSVVPVTFNVASAEDALFAIEPQTVSGGKVGHFDLAVHNRGNTHLDLVMEGADTENVTDIRFDPPVVTALPGEEVHSRATVRGKRPWVGAPIPRIVTFEAVGTGEPLQTVGTFIQKPRIPRVLLVLGALLLILAAWVGLVVFGLGKILDRADPAAEPAGLFATLDEVAQRTVEDQAAAAEEAAAVAEAAAEAKAEEDAAEEAAAAANVGSISGTVQASNLSPPQVVGATATAFGADGAEAGAADTAEDGTYLIEELPDGCYTINFSAPGYQTTEVSTPRSPQCVEAGVPGMFVPGKSGISGIDVVLVGNLGEISGTVAALDDPSGVLVTVEGLGPATAEAAEAAEASTGLARDEVAGVEAVMPLGGPIGVAARLPARPLAQIAPEPVARSLPSSTITGTEGTFTFDNLTTPLTYRITAEKEGFALAATTVVLGPGGAQLDLALELSSEPATLTGSVFDANGDPLGGVSIVISNDEIERTAATPTASAGESVVGTFTVDDLAPGTYRVSFTKEGFLSQEVVVTLEPNAVETIAVPMEGGAGSISGTVTTAGGRGQGGVTVTATGEDGTEFTTVTVTEGVAGSYTITGLPTPGTYTLSYALEGFITGFRTVVLGSSDAAPDIDAVLARAGAIRGLVVDRRGLALGGVTVTLTDDEGNVRTAVTSSQARVVSGVPVNFEVSASFELPGPYTISFAKDNFVPVPGISIEVGQDLPDQVMQGKPGAIIGTVRQALNGTTAFLGGVTVEATEDDAGTFTATSGSTNGEFTVAALPTPATYTVTYERPKFQVIELKVFVDAGETVILDDVTLGRLANLTATVRDRLGQPLSGVRVEAVDFDHDDVQVDVGDIDPLNTSTSGRFAIEDLPSPGIYTLRLSKDNYVTSTVDVEFSVPGVALQREFKLDGASAQLEVQVFGNVFTDALENATVRVVEDGAALATDLTDDRGNVTFSLATPTTVTLQVTKNGYQPFTSTVIQIAPGTARVIRQPLLGYSPSAISGTVVCNSGSKSKKVVLELDGTLLKTTTADARGRYFFSKLSSGAYTVKAGAASVTVNVTFPDSKTDVDIPVGAC